eukprot:gene32041-16571_t
MVLAVQLLKTGHGDAGLTCPRRPPADGLACQLLKQVTVMLVVKLHPRRPQLMALAVQLLKQLMVMLSSIAPKNTPADGPAVQLLADISWKLPTAKPSSLRTQYWAHPHQPISRITEGSTVQPPWLMARVAEAYYLRFMSTRVLLQQS